MQPDLKRLASLTILAAAAALLALGAAGCSGEAGAETPVSCNACFYERAGNEEGIELKSYPIDENENLRGRLNDLQYAVTREDATEPPFNNEYWDNKHAGIYVDIVSGEPLFSSRAKFDSGTGWPSFSAPIHEESIMEREDSAYGMSRTEVRSRDADSHLGHLFNDGPEPTGLRYCINSAALRFIPKEELEAEGYGDYLKLFEE